MASLIEIRPHRDIAC